jgi:protoporphyrinogen oxidase
MTAAMPQVAAPSSAETLVLGAGPGGLATAYGLGEDFHVIEASARPGGLAGSITWNGAVFDIGGHSFSTPHEELKKWIFDLLPMEEQRREARCFFNQRMVRYPFQRFFRECGHDSIVEDCEAGLADRPGRSSDSYRDYLVARLGLGICRHFVFPYNRKLWGDVLDEMSADWANERVAPPAKHEASPVLTDAGSGDAARQPLESDSVVAYPAEGGFGSIFASMARRLGHISFGVSACRIQLKQRRVRLSTGQAISYRRLVSTLPLMLLAEVVEEMPEDLREQIKTLQALPLSIVLVSASRVRETEIQRIYSADHEVSAHKFVLGFNSSASARRSPMKSISAEISWGLGRRVTGRDLEAWVLRDLQAMGLGVAPEDARTRTIEVPMGYPVPTRNRVRVVGKVKEWFRQHDVFLLGRFAEWDYINSDEVMRRAFALARQLRA